MIQPGTYLSNRYEIIEKIGSGGMADVYKAKCHRLNRYVAIKVLKPEFSRDQNFVQKFRAEAQAAAGLSHPNIVNVYDVSEENGLYFIVMELIEGITLKDFILAKGKLSVREAVGITIQIAQGLEVAHQNHIVHRDIKPQNIILSKDGLAKVTDFGIAKAVTSNTITSNAVGSVHYISPEQARGGYSDEKSDIYSLAVTLYEMLCGHVPFTGDSTVNVALQHIQQEAVPLREMDPSIPVSIDKIVQKCMQKKPERRYLSVTDLIADLKRAVRNPDEDFVTMNPVAGGDSPTVVISEQELNHIKDAAGVGTGAAADMAVNKRGYGNSYDSRGDDGYRASGNRSGDGRNSRNTGGRSGGSRKRGDDLDQKDLDPKVEKLMVGGGIAAVVILILVIIFLVGKTVGFFNTGNKDKDKNTTETTTEITTEDVSGETTTEAEGPLVVPRLIGKTLEEVEAELTALGLKMERGEDEASLVYEKGVVISVDPSEGTEVEEGAVVKVIVSSGASDIVLTDLKGKTEAEAVDYLTQNGLKSKIERKESSDVEAGKVISMSPAAGASVAEGDTITLVISEGKGETLVPDIRGMSEADAVQELKKQNLQKGTVTREHSDTVEEGKVISQSIEKNTSVEKDTKIDFVISSGPQTYSADVTVNQSHNPFATEEEEGYIEFVLEQNGNTVTVEEGSYSYGDFPVTFTVTSTTKGNAKIYLIVDGETQPGSINITFK